MRHLVGLILFLPDGRAESKVVIRPCHTRIPARPSFISPARKEGRKIARKKSISHAYKCLCRGDRNARARSHEGG